MSLMSFMSFSRLFFLVVLTMEDSVRGGWIRHYGVLVTTSHHHHTRCQIIFFHLLTNQVVVRNYSLKSTNSTDGRYKRPRAMCDFSSDRKGYIEHQEEAETGLSNPPGAALSDGDGFVT